MTYIRDIHQYLDLKHWMQKQKSFEEQYFLRGTQLSNSALKGERKFKKGSLEFSLEKDNFLFELSATFNDNNLGKVREKTTCKILFY